MLEFADEHLPDLLGMFVGSHVHEGDHHTVDDILSGAVGADAHEETCSTARELKLALHNSERAHHLLYIAVKLIIRQLANDVGDGPAAIHRTKRKY